MNLVKKGDDEHMNTTSLMPSSSEGSDEAVKQNKHQNVSMMKIFKKVRQELNEVIDNQSWMFVWSGHHLMYGDL